MPLMRSAQRSAKLAALEQPYPVAPVHPAGEVLVGQLDHTLDIRQILGTAR